jgi:DNA polymerase kappa
MCATCVIIDQIILIMVYLGMEGVDKEKVQRIVYEMSKGSKYFQNEERKEAFIRHKIENMRVHFAKLTQPDLAHYQKVCMSLI